MRRLCFVIPSLGLGGTQHQLAYLAADLAKDYEVTVFCTEEEGPYGPKLRNAGVYVKSLDAWGLLAGKDPRLHGRLRRLFRKHRPDILHTFLGGHDLSTNEAARETGVPVVISSRRQFVFFRTRRQVRLQQKANRLADCIVANSKAVAECAADQEKTSIDRFRVVYNGIVPSDYVGNRSRAEICQRFGIPEERRVVGIVANFQPVKDHALFVEIARTLLERRTDLHFLMAGEGPTRRDVERLVRRYGIEDRFTRVATVDDIADVYGVLDVSVLCSRAESLPNALIESMAAGVPVVAAAVGGVYEVIEDGVNGRLVTSRDPDAFAGLIAHALDHPDEVQPLVQNGRRRVFERFTAAHMSTAYRNLYNELLARCATKAL